MTEYWVSKKQYWCKYCNIFVRDDAPSRRHHETGLKHQGQKERFIRDLYKTGTNAKHEKLRAEQEMSKINAAAEAAYAKDLKLPGAAVPRMHPSAGASTSRPRESSKPKDKWANYTSAKDLGFTDEETASSSYEIEQQLKGRAAKGPGAWETVVETQQPVLSEEGWDGKRKLGEYLVDDDHKAEGEDFKFEHKGKRPIRDPYDDDDWDPKAMLGSLRVKSKVKKEDGTKEEAQANGHRPSVKAETEGGLDRDKWTGRLDLSASTALSEPTDPQSTTAQTHQGGETTEGIVNHEGLTLDEDVKPPVQEDVKPDVGEETKVVQSAEVKQAGDEDVKPDADGSAGAAPVASNLFKKRRPPPSNRKK